MNRKWFSTAMLAVIFIIILTSVSFADLGGGLDWDSNGWDSSDWGSSSDWGGSSDWGSSSDWGDSDWNSGGGNFFAFLPFMGGGGGIGTLIILAIIYFAVKRSSQKNAGQRSHSGPRTGKPGPVIANRVNVEQLTAKDENFSPEAFESRVGNTFMQLQKAWMNKDAKTLRTFEGAQLYDMHSAQMQEYIEAKKTNKVEDIAILESRIERYEEDESHEFLHVIVRARYRDYVIDDETEKVLKGDPKKRYIMTYRMTFMRTAGLKTKEANKGRVTTCPNCGANLSINQHGVCEYCGSEVTTGDFDWVLTKLTALSQYLAS